MTELELENEEYLKLKKKLFDLQMRKTLRVKDLSTEELLTLKEEIQKVKKDIAVLLFSLKEKVNLEGGLKK